MRRDATSRRRRGRSSSCTRTCAVASVTTLAAPFRGLRAHPALRLGNLIARVVVHRRRDPSVFPACMTFACECATRPGARGTVAPEPAGGTSPRPPPCRRNGARWDPPLPRMRLARSARRRAAGVVGDGEAQGTRSGIVFEVVPTALESRRRHEERDDRGLVGRPVPLLGLINPNR